MIETASDLDASGKEVELADEEEHEKVVTEALLLLEKFRKCRKPL